MLKHRVLTAAVLVPLVVIGVLFSSWLQFMVVTGIIYLYCAAEWTTFIPNKNRTFQIIYLFFIATLMAGCTFLMPNTQLESFFIRSLVWILFFAFISLLWLFAIFLIKRYPHNRDYLTKKHVSVFLSVLVLIPSWAALNIMKSFMIAGGPLLIVLLLVIWIADTGAYFVGNWFGKHKLLPAVSPGKTWEGLVGAIVFTAIFGWVIGYLLKINPVAMALVTVITALFSVVGDLVESMMKRAAGVKDSGQILPGHGGVLDRLDSLMAAAPVFPVLLITMMYFIPRH